MGTMPVLAVLAVAHLERGAGRVDVAQLQVERFGEAQPGGVEDPEQHRVDQRPVGHLRQRLGIDRVEQAADLLVAEHVWRRPVAGLEASQRRRRPRRPAELAGVFCQVAQDDLLAADRGRLEVAAVEESLDGLLDDRPVRVALPGGSARRTAPAPVLGGRTETRRRGGPRRACRSTRAASARSRPRPFPRVKDIFDIERAATQMLGVEPEVVRGGRGARRVTQDRGDDRRGRVALKHRDRQRSA